ncbi:hypothetical protein EOD41_12185 [Mucilaginibacter limnophilus]|uniref:Secreted protein n=1 Tax=Mucilaginibacter limnophilus TaxID=1932778 RepID=A0A3S2WY15_9SPHI|nr:hypothetical protein [Mucilaginibacter limnophilus]RVU00744.1 hypothetical protein EOD41_12185 [Mucilaginibacter limnophilus]
MKTIRNFLLAMAMLVVFVPVTNSVASNGKPISPFLTGKLLPFTTFPCYQIQSSLSSDNSQITFYVLGYQTYNNVFLVPAPSNLTVYITMVANPYGTQTYYTIPISAGVSTVTYPTGITIGSMPGAFYYNITSVSPNSSGSTPIYYDGRTVNCN